MATGVGIVPPVPHLFVVLHMPLRISAGRRPPWQPHQNQPWLCGTLRTSVLGFPATSQVHVDITGSSGISAESHLCPLPWHDTMPQPWYTRSLMDIPPAMPAQSCFRLCRGPAAVSHLWPDLLSGRILEAILVVYHSQAENSADFQQGGEIYHPKSLPILGSLARQGLCSYFSFSLFCGLCALKCRSFFFHRLQITCHLDIKMCVKSLQNPYSKARYSAMT